MSSLDLPTQGRGQDRSKRIKHPFLADAFREKITLRNPVGQEQAFDRVKNPSNNASHSLLSFAGNEETALRIMTIAHQGLAAPVTNVLLQNVSNTMGLTTLPMGGGDFTITRLPDQNGENRFIITYHLSAPPTHSQIPSLDSGEILNIDKGQSTTEYDITVQLTRRANGEYVVSSAAPTTYGYSLKFINNEND